MISYHSANAVEPAELFIRLQLAGKKIGGWGCINETEHPTVPASMAVIAEAKTF